MAVGLNNGATIVYDMQVMSEKYILECHGGAVSSIAFNQNILINGSDYGTIYIFKLFPTRSELVYKCSNVQDNKIPIAKVIMSDFGLAAALDIKGNMRVYDLI